MSLSTARICIYCNQRPEQLYLTLDTAIPAVKCTFLNNARVAFIASLII